VLQQLLCKNIRQQIGYGHEEDLYRQRYALLKNTYRQ